MFRLKESKGNSVYGQTATVEVGLHLDTSQFSNCIKSTNQSTWLSYPEPGLSI